MLKKFIYIVLGAFVVFLVLFLLWYWFFSGSTQSNTSNGTFGTASSTQNPSGAPGATGNIGAPTTPVGTSGNTAAGNGNPGGTPLNPTGSTNSTGAANGSASNGSSNANGTGAANGSGSNGSANANGTGAANGSGSNGSANANGTSGSGSGSANASGAGIGSGGSGGAGVSNGSGSGTGGGSSDIAGSIWLGGSGTTGGGGNGRNFTASEINQLNSGSSGALPFFDTSSITANTTANNGLGLGAAAFGAGAIGVVSCTIQAFGIGASVAVGATAGATAAGAVIAASPAVLLPPPTPLPVPLIVADYGARSGALLNANLQASQIGLIGTQTAYQTSNQSRSFMGCIVNTIAKIALQQITASIVSWINSGFNGQPTFVQNYTQFFAQTADIAAGQFIKDSGSFAFLCSNFKPQIRIAIAQAYANRNAQSCTLSGIISKINNFTSGAFTQGGWPTFLAFTTMPLNNPYGAYAAVQISMGSSIDKTLTQKANELIRGAGFLDVTKQQKCSGFGGDGKPIGCQTVIVTPGKIVADTVSHTLGLPQDQLGIANDLDQIMGALMQQLVTRSLYNGLASASLNASAQGALSPDQQQAQIEAQALLSNLQGAINVAQQFGSVKQGSISDIQQAQARLNTLENCWLAAASSTVLTPAQTQQAAASAAAAEAQIQLLETRIGPYNDTITRANIAITVIENLQTQLGTASSLAEVRATAANFASAQASGQLILPGDITTAQQDRATLQAEMTALNTDTTTKQNQCYALGH